MSFIQNTKARYESDFDSATHTENLGNYGNDKCEYAFSAFSRSLGDCKMYVCT